MKRKKLSFLLAILLSMVGVDAFGSDFLVSALYYSYVNNKTAVEVTGFYSYNYSSSWDGSQSIPSSVSYNGTTYPVTGIGNKAFDGQTRLTRITIPSSVTRIGNLAFSNCTNLKSVSIPNSVTTIGYDAFSGCTSLTSITIPSSVTTIGNEAFSGCNVLTSVNIPNSVTTIEYGTFYGCTGLKSVTIPNSVTTIGSSAFYKCTNLTSVTIPNSVTSIEDFAFYNVPGVSSLPNNLTFVGGRAFYGTQWLDNQPNGLVYIDKMLYCYKGTMSDNSVITLDEETALISGYAFSGCKGLVSIKVPNSVKSIGDGAFQDTGLKSITIGTGVESIGSSLFSGNTPAKVIWLTNAPPTGYANANGTVNYVPNDLYTSLSNKTVYSLMSSMFEVDGVKYVPVSLSDRTCDAIDCKYDESVENVNIGSTVTYRGVALTVKQVHPYAFIGNPYIREAQLNFNGTVGEYAFNGCKMLRTATTGSLVTGIGTYSFGGCTSLQSVEIQKSVADLGASAFRDCTALQIVTLGSDVSAVGTYTFAGCSALRMVTLGSKVNAIGTYSFADCTSLANINIPSNVNAVRDYAFSGCTNLKNVEIADRTTTLTLGSNGTSPLFADCPLKKVYVGGNISYDSSSSRGYSPFYRNTSLETLTMNDKETEVTAREFYGCTGLKTVTIGNGVTSIGDWAFSGCSSLDFFQFGSGVTTIGQEAFSDCTAITHIVGKAALPPACGSGALDDVNKWECSLNVPVGSQDDYRDANQWKEFLFINEEASGDGPSHEMTVTVNDATGTVTVGTTDVTNGPQMFNVEDGSQAVLTLTPAEGCILSKVTVNGVDRTAEVVNGQLAISNVTANMTVMVFFVTVNGENATVTIGPSGMATYCPSEDVDFTTVSGVKAFVGSVFNRQTGALAMTRMYDVPAGTGLLLRGEPGTYEVPSRQSFSVVTNLLEGVATATILSATEDGYANYVLSTGSYGTGFYKVGDAGATLEGGHAYLRIPEDVAPGRTVHLVFDDDENGATAVGDVRRNDGDGAVYDLQGRRVEQPARGLYIRDGRKVIIK